MNDFKCVWNNGIRRDYELRIPWHECEERLYVTLTKCGISYEKGHLGKEWAKRTDFDKSLTSYWHVCVQFRAVNKSWWGAYNPQEYAIPGRRVNNYEWFIKDTDENAERILDEVQRMYENNIVHVDAPADYFERVA